MWLNQVCFVFFRTKWHTATVVLHSDCVKTIVGLLNVWLSTVDICNITPTFALFNEPHTADNTHVSKTIVVHITVGAHADLCIIESMKK